MSITAAESRSVSSTLTSQFLVNIVPPFTISVSVREYNLLCNVAVGLELVRALTNTFPLESTVGVEKQTGGLLTSSHLNVHLIAPPETSNEIMCLIVEI